MLYVNYITISKKKGKRELYKSKLTAKRYQLIFLNLKCIFK